MLTDRSALTDGTDYGVQSRNIWQLADLGAKHALLHAGLGWGHMPHWLVAADFKDGRLESIELEGPAPGIMPFQAVYLAGQLPRLTGRWLPERFSVEFAPATEATGANGFDKQLPVPDQLSAVER